MYGPDSNYFPQSVAAIARQSSFIFHIESLGWQAVYLYPEPHNSSRRPNWDKPRLSASGRMPQHLLQGFFDHGSVAPDTSHTGNQFVLP
jgi:hypothetical protein